MEKIVLYVITYFLLVCSSRAGQEEFYSLAETAIVGGKQFTLEEIEVVSTFRDIPEYQRMIVQVHMLMGIDDDVRYEAAIGKCTHYMETGTLEWAKEYLQMLRGFCYGLRGKRESGVNDLKPILEHGMISSWDETEDIILDMMRKKQPNLALTYDSIMREAIGNYYMDFRKEGMLPEEAYRYLNSIKVKPKRDQNLKQLRYRMGDEAYAKLVETMKADPTPLPAGDVQGFVRPSKNGSTSQEANQGSTAPPEGGLGDKGITHSLQASEKHANGSQVRWLIIGGVCAFVAGSLVVWRRKFWS